MKRRVFLTKGGVAGLGLSLPSMAVTSRSTAAGPQQGNSYEPLGQVPITGAAEAVVGDEEIAYVAATTGFAVVDVSDPADPTILAEERDIAIDGASLTQILDLTVDGDRLIVAGPAETARSSDLYLGVRRYDVSDPERPVPTGAYETGYHIHNCYLEGDRLFLVENTQQDNRLVIVDIGGDEITQIGDWSLLDHEPGWRDVHWLGRYLHDVFVQDGTAYLPCWNAGTYVLDISEPADLSVVSHIADTTLEAQRELDDFRDGVYGLPGNDHYAAVDDSGDLLAVGREAWATGGAAPDHPGGIDLYDVRDLTDPVHRGSIDAPRTVDESYRGGTWTTAHNFELRDDRLYSAWYRAGVQIHDVSDPTDPERLAWWRDPAETGFWTARVVGPGEAFIASSTEAIPNTSLEGALYTFPAEAGEQTDPPSLQPPAEWLGEDDPNETSGTEPDAGSDSSPGFTGVAGLVSGGVALEWLRRRRGNVQD
ncbi:LVIVD repeat-containing protein [Natrinema sp. HArc-T2]|uniref:LVIVD repeat-containing protein n=1 Tax=Natrinema sp. HArc-T2 TaxID=3242701 RepID=UPI00359E5EA6